MNTAAYMLHGQSEVSRVAMCWSHCYPGGQQWEQHSGPIRWGSRGQDGFLFLPHSGPMYRQGPEWVGHSKPSGARLSYHMAIVTRKGLLFLKTKFQIFWFVFDHEITLFFLNPEANNYFVDYNGSCVQVTIYPWNIEVKKTSICWFFCGSLTSLLAMAIWWVSLGPDGNIYASPRPQPLYPTMRCLWPDCNGHIGWWDVQVLPSCPRLPFTWPHFLSWYFFLFIFSFLYPVCLTITVFCYFVQHIYFAR